MVPPHHPRRPWPAGAFILPLAAAVLLAGVGLLAARAQNTAAPPENPTAKWLAEQDPQWQASFQREVTESFDKALADLNKQYLANVQKQLDQASRDNKLDDALIYRAERDRVTAAGTNPLRDEAGLPPAIDTQRAAYRKSLLTLETERMDRAKRLLARYDSILAQNLTALTRAQRLDEALLIKAKREEVAAAWVKATAGLPVASPAAAPPPSPVASATPPASPAAQATPAPAWKPGAASPRALVAKLLAMGVEVRAPDPLKSVNQLSSDSFVVVSVSFSKSINSEAVSATAALNPGTFIIGGEAAGKLTLDGWERLEGASGLKKVDLTSSPKPGLFSRLAKVKSLEEINMHLGNGSAHKNADIAALAALPNLRYLRLASTPLSGAVFAKWPAGSALQNLLVPQSGNFDEAELQALVTAAPKLSELSVGAVTFNDAKVKILSQLASLKQLRVANGTPDAMVRKLQEALPKAKVEIRKDERF